MSKISTAIGIWRDQGMRQLLKESKNYTVGASKGIFFDVETSNDYIKRISETVLVEQRSNEKIEYEGMHDITPDYFDTHLGSIETNEKYCYEIPDARIIGPYGIIEFDGKYIIPDTIGWNERDTTYKQRFVKEFPIKRHISVLNGVEKVEESYFILRSTYRGGNFGLWYYEVLPKLYWFEKFVSKTGIRPTILVPELSSFQEKSLQLLGYDPTEYHQISNEVLEPSTVVLPPQPGIVPDRPVDISHKSINWVRNKLLSNNKSENYPSRIYISREDANWRYVLNKDEVLDTLDGYGFREFTLSNLDLIDQIKLFYGADTVVGPHGAGMAHMMHTTDCNWVELFPGEMGALPMYFVLSNHLDLNYEYLVCKPSNIQYPDSNPPRKRDMTVEIQDLKIIIESFIQPSPNQRAR